MFVGWEKHPKTCRGVFKVLITEGAMDWSRRPQVGLHDPGSGGLISIRAAASSIGCWGHAGLAVKPLDLHLVNVGSIPTGPTHGEGRLQPPPGDLLANPDCSEEPQIRLESGGEAERSPNLWAWTQNLAASSTVNARGLLA